MFWLVVLLVSIPCRHAEPTSCSEDSHCPVDYYCELDAYSCRQCLQCESFKRAPPLGNTICVKSVVECGACLEQKNHDTIYDCGPTRNIMSHLGDMDSKEIKLPVYAWVLLVLIVAVIIGGVTLIPWINRVTYVSVSRSESQTSPAGTNDHLESAWSSPPAYNAVVNIPSANMEEEAALYVKPIVTAPPDEADRQATRPYSPPNYIRGPQLTSISTSDIGPIHNNTEMENSVDGVVDSSALMVNEDNALPTGTESNLAMEECPNVTSGGSYPAIRTISEPGHAGSASPFVVVNNNVHLQSVSLSGAHIFLPQSSNSVERR